MIFRLASRLYDSPLRAVTRALGINHLLTIPARRRQRARLAAYDRDRPDRVRIAVGELTAELLVSDATEYMRVRSAEEDHALIAALAASVAPGESYWDIGSSIGIYALLLAKQVGPAGRVVAFEPEPRSFERLSANVALNGATNVVLRPFALADASRRMSMSLAGPASTGAHRLDAEASGPDTTVVDVLRGDTFRHDYGEKVPAAIKVDVEGAEEAVIRGLGETLREPECRTLLCEVHFSIHAGRSDGDAPARIRALLSEAGFTRQEWIDSSHLLARK